MTIHANISSSTGPYAGAGAAVAGSSGQDVSTEKQGHTGITHSTDGDRSLYAEDNELTVEQLATHFQHEDLTDDIGVDGEDDGEDIFYEMMDDDEWTDTFDAEEQIPASKTEGRSQQGIDELDSGIFSEGTDEGGMPPPEPSPIKHEKPYSLKEKQQDYNELMATRGEVKDALEKTPYGVPFATRGNSPSAGATSILNGIKTFEMATPDLLAVNSLSQSRTEEIDVQIKKVKAEVDDIQKQVAQYKGEEQGADHADALDQYSSPSAPEATTWKETFSNLGNNVKGILTGTQRSLTQVGTAGVGVYLSSVFGGILGFSGTAISGAYALNAIASLPQNISDAQAEGFLKNKTQELMPKLIKLFHLETERNVQQRNVERVRISINERKIQKNALILEAKRLDFELGARALADSRLSGATQAYEVELLNTLKSANPDDFEDLQGLIEKQERVVALSSKLANPVSEPVADLSKQHPVSVGKGQASKSIRTNAAQSAPAFTVLFSAIGHQITSVAAAVANKVDFWSDLIAAHKARKGEKALYSDDRGKELMHVLTNDPDRVDSVRLARENSEHIRSDEQSKSLLIGMRLSDNLALQKDSGAGSLLIKNPLTEKTHLVTPTITMARHLVNYLTDVADQQVQPGAFEATAQEDGSFIVNDPDRKIYSFLSYVPTAYTSTMGAANAGQQFTPGVAALTIDDPNGSFPGNTSSIQFNMELDAQGKEVLRVRLSHDKHKPVFAALNNESATGTRTIQDIPNVERLINRPTDFSKLSTQELEARKSHIYAEIQSADKLIEGDFKQINVLKNQENLYFRPLDPAAQKQLVDEFMSR